MERISAALRSFWVVDMLGGVSDVAWFDGEGGKGRGTDTFEYSWIAGRNFSWMSQMLWWRVKWLDRFRQVYSFWF